MTPYTIIAGFTCSEGQDIAYLKEIGISGVAIVLFITTLVALRKNWRTMSTPNKMLRLLGIVTAGAITAAVMLVGPFFYSSWGCTTIIESLFGH